MEQLGSTLRSARERKGLTLGDLQQLTKIRTRYLEAIEEGDLDSLPGQVYARGFIKSYAEQVGLDGQSLLEQFGLASTGNEPVEVSPAAQETQSFRKSSGLNPRIRSYLLQGTIVLIVLGVVTASFQYFMSHRAPRTPVTPGTLAQPGSNVISPDPSVQSSVYGSPANQNTPAPPAAEKTTPLEPTDKQNGISNFTIPADSPLEVVLTAKDGSCWIGVMADGKQVEQVTLQTGETKTYTATSDLLIKTGAGPHISMQMGKQPVVIEPVFGRYDYHFHH